VKLALNLAEGVLSENRAKIENVVLSRRITVRKNK
jgi:hypothetical protein